MKKVTPLSGKTAAQTRECTPARVVRLDALPATPWKNGGGVTRELAREESPDGCGFAWRLSMADIEQPGPFSDFLGYRRQLILLDGTGLVLGRPGTRGVRLDQPGDTHIFDGADEISATLHGGPCRDVNIMTAHGASSHWEMQLLRDALLDIAGDFVLFPVQGWWEAYAAVDVDVDAAPERDDPAARLRGQGSVFPADPHPAALIAEPGSVLVHLGGQPAAALTCTGNGLSILLRRIPHR